METITIPERHRTWDIVDSSKLDCYATCPRKFFYEYILGWRSETPSHHLIYGAAIHKALEVLYTSRKWDESILLEAFKAFNDYYRETFPDPSFDEVYAPKAPGFVHQLLVDYITKYSDDLANFDILHIEVAGEIPVSYHDNLHYRIDAIVENESGVWILEHKTGGSALGKQKEMELSMGFQLGTYIHVLYSCFKPERVRGAIVNYIQPLKTMNKFQRLTLRVSPAQMETWLARVNFYYLNLLNDITSLVKRPHLTDGNVMICFPQNPTACGKYFGCSHYDFCIAWDNPLRFTTEPPMGMRVEWWDPSDYQGRKILKPKKPPEK